MINILISLFHFIISKLICVQRFVTLQIKKPLKNCDGTLLTVVEFMLLLLLLL